MLPVVLYGCECLPIIVKEEHWQRVFENGVLREISGLKRAEITEEWQKLCNEDFHELCSFLDIIEVINLRNMRLVGLVPMGDK